MTRNSIDTCGNDLERRVLAGRVWDRRKSGEICAKLARITVIRRSDGSVYRHVAQFTDVTEKKEKDELIFWQANYDSADRLAQSSPVK